MQHSITFKQNIKPGKQGFVGILEKDGKDYVFKMSQYINYLIHHESIVMQGLNIIGTFCPHFCKYFETIIEKVDPKIKSEGNPFEINYKYPVKKEIMLCELIERSTKFYNYIRAIKKIDEKILYSSLKQVLLAICIAQQEKQFTHYDLHSNNIMMKKCDKDLVFLYILDTDNQFCVPSYGHYPILIDFGFSYIEDMEDAPLWASMGHTDIGFMSDRFDPITDAKLLLVTVSGEIKDLRRTKNAKKLRRITKNLFYPIKMDWESGWDDVEKKSAADYVINMFKRLNKDSEFFKEYDYYCIDILQTLIVLPLEPQDYSDPDIAYKTFITEWCKIENEISTPFYNLYILKGIVDSARKIHASYLDLDTRKDALKTFREDIRNCLDEISEYCMVKDIHYEKMLCSLYMLSNCIEGILFDVNNSRTLEKHKEYDKLPLKSCTQIYGALECNIPSNYTYTKDTKIMFIDCIKKEKYLHTLEEEEIKNVNAIHNISKGCYIYDLFVNKETSSII